MSLSFRLSMLFSCFALLCAPAVRADAAAGAAGDVSVYQGSARVLPYGDLVDCSEYAPVTQVLQTQLTYSALPGVCDDLGTRPCAGRLIAQMERCLGGGNATLASGGLAGGYSRSPIQLCFEPSDPGMGCNTTNVIARGIWTGAGYASTAETVLTGVAGLSIRSVRGFQLDGVRVRVRTATSAQHFSLEKFQPGPANCGVTPAGCGMIGVGLY